MDTTCASLSAVCATTWLWGVSLEAKVGFADVAIVGIELVVLVVLT